MGTTTSRQNSKELFALLAVDVALVLLSFALSVVVEEVLSCATGVNSASVLLAMVGHKLTLN